MNIQCIIQNETEEYRTIPTFVGQVHIEPGAVVHLFDYHLALKEGQIELLVEEAIRDTNQTWLVHQHNRATLVVKLPPTPESDTLVVSRSASTQHHGENGCA